MSDDSILDSPNLLPLLSEAVHDIIDSCIMDGIMVMHRAIKLGYFNVIAPELTEDDDSCGNLTSLPRSGSQVNTTTVSSGRDNSSKTASCCRCVKCHSKVAATRFAPHLSNCMGLGRNSSRRANKRIAEQQRLEDYDDEELEDDYKHEHSNASSSSSSSLHTSSSDTAISRYANGATNRQHHHSPLKLTIALVPTSNKSESCTKHVVRTMNGSSESSDSLVVPCRGTAGLRLTSSVSTRTDHQGKPPSSSSGNTVVSSKLNAICPTPGFE